MSCGVCKPPRRFITRRYRRTERTQKKTRENVVQKKISSLPQAPVSSHRNKLFATYGLVAGMYIYYKSCAMFGDTSGHTSTTAGTYDNNSAGFLELAVKFLETAPRITQT